MRTVTPLLLAASVACARSPAALSDATLPEATDMVEARDPLAVLEAATASLDPSLRARALWWLVHTTDDLDAWGPRGVHDPSPWVQKAVVQALSQRHPASDALLRAVAERADVHAGVRSLAALQLPSGSVDLHEAWTTATDPWTRAPLALAAHHHGDAEAEDALAAALATGSLDLDLEWFTALGERGSPTLFPALEQAQERVEPDLAITIAAARLAMGDPRAEAALRKALGGDPEQRLEVLDRLGPLVDDTAGDLIRRAEAHGPDIVRTYAELLLTARDGVHPERLRKSLDDPDREVRWMGVMAAEQALRRGPASKVVAREARRTLVDALADPDLQVRAEAARAVGDLRVHEGRAALEPLLTDEVEWVRVEASGALLALR